jgi:hypothetical protein
LLCRATHLFGALAAVHDVASGASLPARAAALEAVLADARLAPRQAAAAREDLVDVVVRRVEALAFYGARVRVRARLGLG